MKTQNVLISLIAIIALSGCSTLKERFLGVKTTPTMSTKPLEYNFSQPRRSALNPTVLAKLNDTKVDGGGYKYYSANGHECRNISSDFSRTACKVDGNWKESAPVLVVRIP